jgi:hypothetical protein
MKKRPLLFAVATSVALLCAVAHAADRNIRRWVDEKGVVHYGDAPPPEAIKNGSTVLNPQGVPVQQYPRQLTPDEAAAAKQNLETESRRRAQDSFLLNTYAKVSDIENARDDQLELIDSHIDLAKGSVLSSDQKLESLRSRMEKFRPYSAAPNARRVPDALADEVVHALGERRTIRETLGKHEQRKEETRAKFAADIARYRELINRPSIR